MRPWPSLTFQYAPASPAVQRRDLQRTVPVARGGDTSTTVRGGCDWGRAAAAIFSGRRLAEKAGSDTPDTEEITFVEKPERVDKVKVLESVENP